METKTVEIASESPLTNGLGAAAVLAAGIGSFALGVCTVASDVSPSLRSLFNVYKPTGPLSGVTATALVVWLIAWVLLNARWKMRTVRLSRITGVAAFLLCMGLLLTFPPVIDLL